MMSLPSRATRPRGRERASRLRRCEVLGLRLGDLHAAERRVFIAEGKGGRQRLIPVSGRFFAAVAAYLDAERPPGAQSQSAVERSSLEVNDRQFVCLLAPSVSGKSSQTRRRA